MSDSTKKQFGILKKLMGREDVTSLVEATDAGREGELIFRLVYAQTGCKKPFERLWISSMEDEAILEGFENLRPGTEYNLLYEAALCRERADWTVGIMEDADEVGEAYEFAEYRWEEKAEKIKSLEISFVRDAKKYAAEPVGELSVGKVVEITHPTTGQKYLLS